MQAKHCFVLEFASGKSCRSVQVLNLICSLLHVPTNLYICCFGRVLFIWQKQPGRATAQEKPTRHWDFNKRTHLVQMGGRGGSLGNRFHIRPQQTHSYPQGFALCFGLIVCTDWPTFFRVVSTRGEPVSDSDVSQFWQGGKKRDRIIRMELDISNHKGRLTFGTSSCNTFG